MKPTERQMEFINDMEEWISEKFTGTTKQEATEYISKHIEQYKLLTLSNWQLEY